VIDSDAHFAEPADLWSSRGLPTIEGTGWNAVKVNGVRLPAQRWDHPVDVESYGAGLGRIQRDAFQHGYDPGSYVRAFAREGITDAVLYPTRGLALLSCPLVPVVTLHRACEVFNEWAAEFCADSESGLGAAGMLALSGRQHLAHHAEDCGLSSVVTVPHPSVDFSHPDLDNVYDFLACAGLPLVFHTGAGAPDSYGSEQSTYLRAHAMVHPFTMMRALMEIVVGGVLARHPKLRVGFFEAGAWWLPGWIERLDAHALGHFGAQHYALPRLPSQYVKDGNVFVTLDAGEPIGALVDAGLEKCLLFASDYPHGDAAWPYARRLTERAAGAWWRQISETNPRRLYRLKETR
jgi:predicted TIM-barrel fold metal-dependent hydrolase